MPYDYKIERPKLFTEEGQVTFLKIRDKVNSIINYAGAVRGDKATNGVTSDSWFLIACLDRMIELQELVCLSSDGTWAQYKVYTTSHPFGD